MFIVCSAMANDTLWVDVEGSHISWTGRKVAGEHTGTLNLLSGWVVMQDDLLIDGELIFDMNSIANLDVESPKWKQKLEDHLKNEDFFDVPSFPLASLIVSGSSEVTDKKAGRSHVVSSALTIKEVTKDISFPVIIKKSENKYTAEGSVEVDRTEYGIQYKSGKFFPSLGDKIIEDIFTVQFTLIAK